MAAFTTSPIPTRIVEPAGARAPAVIFLHGLGVSKETHAKEAESLADAGLAAVLLDAPHHGERRSELLDEMDRAHGDDAFGLLLRLVAEAADEIPGVVDGLLARGHPRVAIAGISMGAFTALAAGADEPRLAAIVSILGSPEWTPPSGHVPEHLSGRVERSPARRLAAFAPRPLLLLNAGLDQHVPPAPARRFAEALRPLYPPGDERLVHREYPRSDHFVRPEDWDDLWSTAVAFLCRWVG
jgi:dienelactone hydrolase